MAQWAIAAETLDDLERTIQQGLLKGWQSRLADGTAVTFDRLYLGDEFCHHLIPSLNELERAIELTETSRVGLTLATPPLTDEGLAEWHPLIARLAEVPGTEVVTNDWGLLRRVAREFPALSRLLGRTLRRQLKDPRAESAEAHGRMTDAYAKLLGQFGVRMVEMDRLPDESVALASAVHWPYEFVASGRICAVSGVPFPETKKFLVDFSCPKPCRQFYLELSDPSCRTPLRQKGNTQYAPNGVVPGAAWVDRWVYDLSVDKTHSALGRLEALV